MRIKKQNAVTVKILVKDSAGIPITDLSSASEIYFMVKKQLTDVDSQAVISKTLGASQIAIDDPSTGYLKIVLDSDDTDKEPDFYYMMAQIKYSSTNKQEVDLTESGVVVNQLEIYQDGIRGS